MLVYGRLMQSDRDAVFMNRRPSVLQKNFLSSVLLMTEISGQLHVTIFSPFHVDDITQVCLSTNVRGFPLNHADF